jgi:integrase
MARTYQMTWVPSRRGWMKEYGGRKYAISCRQLSELMGKPVPETKEGSYQDANAWWAKKKAELDEASKPKIRPLLPMEDTVTALLGYQGPLNEQDADTLNLANACLDAGLNGKPGVFLKIDEEGNVTDCWPASLGRQPSPEDRIQAAVTMTAARIVGQILQGQPLPDHTANLLPPARVRQLQDAITLARGEPAAPAEKTVQAHASAWIASQEKQAAAGQVTVARVHNVRMALAHFTRWLGETVDVNTIDAGKLQGFYEYCLTQVATRLQDKKAGWSVPFAKEVFAIARSWLKWLTEQGTIDPPRNLASRFRFGSTAKKIATWTVEEVQHIIGEAPGKLKLALLLMANCGMTQQDVSDLQDDEVDWARGSITRRRSKAKNYENAPTVTYRLWPETFRLLRKYRSGKELVLLTESGKPYIRKELTNGKLKKADGFTSNYAHLKRRLRFRKPMKLLRKTAASLLAEHETYGRLVPHFLGHSPRSVADKNYVQPPQELFDKAVWWLGQQLGQA